MQIISVGSNNSSKRSSLNSNIKKSLCSKTDVLDLSFKSNKTDGDNSNKKGVFDKIWSVFKSDNTKLETEKPHKLSDDEFSQRMDKIYQKISKDKVLSKDEDIFYVFENLNKCNIFNFEAYLNKGAKYDNYLNVIPKIKNLEDAKKLDLILNDEKIAKNTNLRNIFNVSLTKKNYGQDDSSVHFINEFFKDEAIYKNDTILNSLDEITNIIHYKNNEDIVFDLIFNKEFIDNYLKNEKGKIYIDEPYLKNQYRIVIENKNTPTKFLNTEKISDKYEIISTETVYERPEKLETVSVKENTDGSKYISVIKNDFVEAYGRNELMQTEQKNTKYDSEGNRVQTEIIKTTKNNPDLYRVILAKPNHKPVIEEKNDNLSCNKEFHSFDNVKTEYLVDINNGFKFKITDNNGDELFSINRKFEKIDENSYKTCVNGKEYLATYSDNGITISYTNKDGEKQSKTLRYNTQIDKQLKNIYKQIPADYLLKLKEMYTGIEYIDNARSFAEFDNNDNIITVSGRYKNSPYALVHEIGHAVDKNRCGISEELALRTIFNEELKNYKKNSTNIEGEAIDYFTTLEHVNNNNCLTEVVAETNSIISGVINTGDKDIKLREIVLEKHFPRTIAYIANRLTKNN